MDRTTCPTCGQPLESDNVRELRMHGNRLTLRLHLPCNIPIDTECGLVFTTYDSRCTMSYGLQAKVVETTKPDDNPAMRLVTIEISK